MLLNGLLQKRMIAVRGEKPGKAVLYMQQLPICFDLQEKEVCVLSSDKFFPYAYNQKTLCSL